MKQKSFTSLFYFASEGSSGSANEKMAQELKKNEEIGALFLLLVVVVVALC